MKIVFDDKSYADCYKSAEPGKIVLVISAKDQTDPLKKITNAVELTTEQFKQLISDVQA
jgi:nitrate reductase NapAB chaperone NapD